MKKVLLTFAMVLFGMGGLEAFGDDHGGSYANMNLNERNSLQVNLCNLKPGKTIADLDGLNDAYFKWAEKNGTARFFMRLTPLFTGATPTNPGYDYIDMIASTFAVAGEEWDNWLGTPEGQKLNARWGELATCYVRMTHNVTKYADTKALAADDDRIVTLEWCDRQESVSTDQLIAKHNSLAANFPEGIANIYWGLLLPQLGNSSAPAQFAHMDTYPDVKALMARQNWLGNEGGWRVLQDYYTSYASCSNRNVFSAKVLHRPSR